MARILPLPTLQQTAPIALAFKLHVENFNARITNMKATLAHSLLAFNVYMEWYPLYEAVQKITGHRLAYLYAFAISSASGCPLCSTFFRKIIIDAGEKPEALVLTEQDQRLLDFGASIAAERGKVPADIYNPVAAQYTQEEMVVLIAFAGQMIATNIFSNVTETDIDDYLTNYIKTNDQ